MEGLQRRGREYNTFLSVEGKVASKFNKHVKERFCSYTTGKVHRIANIITISQMIKGCKEKFFINQIFDENIRRLHQGKKDFRQKNANYNALRKVLLLTCLNVSMKSLESSMSLNIPSSLPVKFGPHSALSLLSMLFSASTLADLPNRRRLARSWREKMKINFFEGLYFQENFI